MAEDEMKRNHRQETVDTPHSLILSTQFLYVAQLFEHPSRHHFPLKFGYVD